MISKKRKSLLKEFKGFYGKAKNCFTVGRRLYQKKMNYEFVGRKDKKGDARSKFIVIINAFCRMNGSKYSHAISKIEGTPVDRKTLALMIQNHPEEAKKLLQL